MLHLVLASIWTRVCCDNRLLSSQRKLLVAARARLLPNGGSLIHNWDCCMNCFYDWYVHKLSLKLLNSSVKIFHFILEEYEVVNATWLESCALFISVPAR